MPGDRPPAGNSASLLGSGAAEDSQEAKRKGPPVSPATYMANLARIDTELFHTPEGEPYIAVPVCEYRENFRLRDPEFEEWLARRYFEQTQRAASSSALAEATKVLQGFSKYGAAEQRVYTRVAESEGGIFLDLADKSRHVAKVSPEGRLIVDRYPVKFRRPPGMQALPLPQPGGNVNELRPFVNVAGEDQWVLLVAWLLSALRPSGPYPLLVLQGNHGSSKSTVSRVMKSLSDPNTAPLRSAPRDIRDLMIAASNGWCMGFDNFSGVPDWLADAFCRLSTGGGFSTRQLYTNGQEMLFNAMRPIVLNGIDVGISRGDLLDRAIVLTLPSISRAERMTEQAFWQSFEAAKPRVLGALLDGVACGLRRLPEINIPNLPRMADFAKWIVACEPALGWPEGTFLAAYERNRRENNELGLEGSILVPALRDFAAKLAHWKGTTTELLHLLEGFALHGEAQDRTWPKVPKQLSEALRRLAPNLEQEGIRIEFTKTSGSNSQKVIVISTEGASDSG